MKEFEIRADYTRDTELWVPSEELDVFNQAIVGNIEVIKVFVGNDFKGYANREIESLVNALKIITTNP